MNFEKDVEAILMDCFFALNKKRKCNFKEVPKDFYDDEVSGEEKSLLTTNTNAQDLKIGDEVSYKEKKYIIYRIETHTRITKRIFIR